jgi:hypothetical protein
MTRGSFRLGALLALAAAAPGGFSVVEATSPSPRHGVSVNQAPDLPPAFDIQPAGRTVSVGDSTAFYAWAEGVPPPSFQWQISTDEGLTWSNVAEGAAFTGTTQFELQVNSTTMTENGSWFRVMAVNSAGVEFSVPAILSVVVGTVPTIQHQPANAGTVVGNTAQFLAGVQGTPAPAVQWQISSDGSHWQDLRDSAILGGVTTTTLSVTPVDVSLNGALVRMTATNSAGTAVTAPAILTVSTLAIVPSIVQQPTDSAVPINSATFSIVAVGAPTPTYQWQTLTANGWVDLQDNGNPLSPPTIVYAGSQTPTLTVTVTCCGRLSWGFPILGMQVRAIVTNAAGRVISSTAQAVSAPAMQLDRSSLSFGATETSTAFASQTGAQTIRMTQQGSDGRLSWTAATNQPWLVVTPTSGSGPVSFSVSVKWVPGLAPVQHGTITITFPEELTFTTLFLASPVRDIPVSLSVLPATAAFPPFGSFDSPADGSTGVAGSIAVSGWALDAVQATRVTICRDPSGSEIAPVDANCAGNAKIYVGDALFVDGARPDVVAAFPTAPINTRAGWGYLMLTNFLPNLGNGTFTFTAYAFDVDGRSASLGSKTITCNNNASVNPFGSIDTPAQGEVISGSYTSFGWVLSPGTAKADGADGGTVQAFVDGTNIGTPGGWGARPDLTALFPAAQYSGIDKALAVIGLDSTAFSNGLHTYVWNVTDTAAHSGGIGSRFIGISNGSLTLVSNAAHASNVIAGTNVVDIPYAAALRIGPSTSALLAEVDRAPTDDATIQGRRGFDLDRAPQAYPLESGRIDVQAEELDRVELHLSASYGNHYSGYLRTSAGLMPLPIGSHLDASTGEFTWMPGVGFNGVYDFVFVRWTNGVAAARQDVRVTLNARGSNRVGPQTIIDVPGAGGVFDAGQPFFLGGWAADLDSAVDTGVATVHVWVYPVDANGTRKDPAFLGAAIYRGARPDVAAVYGERFLNSGYGMIVPGLAPGTYDIVVFGLSTVVGNFTPGKVVRVTVR